ncbi:MAG: glycoside hydrolase family 28 protein [Prolixibacteraceae bacterium]
MKSILTTILAIVLVLSIQAKEYNVLDFGAKGDSSTINTKAIQAAIDACSETKGKLVFPSGNYISGTVFIKSNVNIELQEGAVLYGSINLDDYPDIKHGMYVYKYAHHAFIYAYDAHNISITGKGRIDGRGAHPQFSLMRESDAHMHRPYMMQFIKCENVRIEGIELYNPSFWLQQYLECENVFILGLKVNSHSAPNNDGLDIDDCNNVVVSDCIIYCEDDALCFKSTSPMGCDNISITNCILQTNANAIKFGTDGHSAFRNINISNIVINEPRKDVEAYFNTYQGICGIAFEAVDGTILENINISNVTIKNTDTPFYIKQGDRLRKSSPDEATKKVGVCRNITLTNIIATGVSPYASSISGIPGHPVENIIFDNIIIKTKGYAGYNPDDLLDVPEKSKNYPSPEIYGVFPAHSFYVRHAKNITFKNMQIFTDGADSRHTFVLDDVHGFRISEVDFHSKGNPDAIRLINSSNGMITLNQLFEETGSLVKIQGEESSNIMITGNNARKAENILLKGKEVKPDEINLTNNWE